MEKEELLWNKVTRGLDVQIQRCSNPGIYLSGIAAAVMKKEKRRKGREREREAEGEERGER